MDTVIGYGEDDVMGRTAKHRVKRGSGISILTDWWSASEKCSPSQNYCQQGYGPRSPTSLLSYIILRSS